MMQHVQLTDTLSVSRVIVGCMRIADAKLEGAALLRFVEACLELGVDTFDHAPVYGGYTCEKIFGDAVVRAKPSLRSQMKFVTKAGITLPGRKDNSRIYYDSRKSSILAEMDESLERLGTDHVELLLIHRPDPLSDPAETADALETIVRQGKALHVGVSNYTPADFEALQSKLTIPLVTNQLEFSVKTVDNFFNGISDDLFRRGIKPMAWSPLGGGDVFNCEDAQSIRLRETLKMLARKYGRTIDEIMYAWLYRHPLCILPITGTTNIDRIRAAVNALSIELSYDEWYTVLAASRGYDVP